MQEEQFWNRNKAAFILASGIGLFLAVIFTRYAFSHPGSSLSIEQLGNIKTYVIGVMIWFAASVLSFLALSKILPENDKKVLYVGIAVAAAAVVFFGYVGYEMYLICDQGFRLKYLLTFIAFAAGTVLIYHFYDKERFTKIKDAVIVLEILAFSALWYFSCCFQNTFSDWSFGSLYNVFHTSAYIDSISNVFWGHPYYGLECDLYGHYGLFFIIPLKIFGANTRTIGVIMGILAAVTFASFGFAIHLSVKQFIVKFASIVTLGLSGILAVSMYWQSFPHRMLFPALTLLAITLMTKFKLGWKSYSVGLLIPLCAVIWNFETGILCAIAWGVYGGRALPEKINKILRLVIAEIISVVVSCGGALAVLNIFNMTRKGPEMGFAELRGFAKASEHISSISSPVEIGNVEFIHAIIFLMICVLWGFWKFLIDNEDSPKVMYSIAVAVFGLGIITYFVNDSQGGPTIFRGYLIMAAAAIASGVDSKKDLYAIVKKGACLYACVAIFIYGALNRLFWKDAINLRANNCLNYDEFKSFADGVNSEIDPDTIAEGYGVSALYLAMGRDDCTDDLNLHYEDIEDSEYFLTYFVGDEVGDYRIVRTFGYNGLELGYYQRVQVSETAIEE